LYLVINTEILIPNMMYTENQVEIPTQNQEQQQFSPEPLETKKANYSLFVGVLILLAMVVSGAYYLGTLNAKIPPSTAPIVESTPAPIIRPSESPKQIDETDGWKAQQLPTLGIEFKLPTYLSKMDYPNGNEIPGTFGRQFCIEYLKEDITSLFVKRVWAGGGACNPAYFGLGTTSVDYEQGRSGGFGDLQGYTIENGEYYAKAPTGKTFLIPIELVTELTNINNVKILKVIGKTSQPESPDMFPWPIPGTPGDGRIGALINLENNSTYPGVSVEMKIDGKLSEELFDQILSTFEFVN